MLHDCRLVKGGNFIDDAGLYIRLIGKLSYLTITRPDIAFSVFAIVSISWLLYNRSFNGCTSCFEASQGSIRQGLFYSSKSNWML